MEDIEEEQPVASGSGLARAEVLEIAVGSPTSLPASNNIADPFNS